MPIRGASQHQSYMPDNTIGTGLGPAPSGYGSEYDQLFAANPYRNLTYEKSGLQKFLSFLGFRTGADAFRENAQVNAAEYDAGIFSMIQQNEYNSPVQQAQRMRAAGLNPDLQGLGDVASAASPTEDPNGMPDANADIQRANEVVKGFATGIVSALTAGMSFFKDVTAIAQMKTAIDGQNVELAGKIMGSIDDYILGAISSDAAKDDASFLDALNNVSTPDFSSWGYSPKRAQQATGMFSSRLYGLQNDLKARQMLLNRAQSITGLNQEKTSPLYESGFSEQEMEVMQMMIDSLRSTASDAMKQHYKNQLHEENLREGELQNIGVAQDIEGSRLDALDKSDFGTESGFSEAYEKHLQKTINYHKKLLADKLQEAADHGNDAARCTLYAMALQDMLQFEVSVDGDFSLLGGISKAATDIFSNKPQSMSSIGRKWSKGLGFDIGLKARTK